MTMVIGSCRLNHSRFIFSQRKTCTTSTEKLEPADNNNTPQSSPTIQPATDDLLKTNDKERSPIVVIVHHQHHRRHSIEADNNENTTTTTILSEEPFAMSDNAVKPTVVNGERASSKVVNETNADAVNPDSPRSVKNSCPNRSSLQGSYERKSIEADEDENTAADVVHSETETFKLRIAEKPSVINGGRVSSNVINKTNADEVNPHAFCSPKSPILNGISFQAGNCARESKEANKNENTVTGDETASSKSHNAVKPTVVNAEQVLSHVVNNVSSLQGNYEIKTKEADNHENTATHVVPSETASSKSHNAAKSTVVNGELVSSNVVNETNGDAVVNPDASRSAKNSSSNGKSPARKLFKRKKSSKKN